MKLETLFKMQHERASIKTISCMENLLPTHFFLQNKEGRCEIFEKKIGDVEQGKNNNHHHFFLEIGNPNHRQQPRFSLPIFGQHWNLETRPWC